ncbi:MAG: polysaccharide biosynthesis protein [Phycisphaerales bacterium]|nr:polysaccharide biosynthesis protein [Phycisphaerales bacterium]
MNGASGKSDNSDLILSAVGAGGSVVAPALVADPRPDALGAPLDCAPVEPLSLKARAVRGSLWTVLLFGAGQVVRVGSTLVLARLLTPSDFGTLALVTVFVTAVYAFADVGIEQAIIQNPRGDEPVFLNTAWTLHIVRGVLLWLGCCAIALPVYWIFRDKANARMLLAMLPIAGLNPLISGFNATRLISFKRHMQLGRVTLFELAQQMLTVAVQVAVAFAWPSPWSIIFGSLAGSVFLLVASHTLMPGIRNRFCWDPVVRKEILKFGKWIVVSTLFTFAAMQIDRPLLDKLLDEAWLGLYIVAINLVRLPAEVITRLTAVSLFPTLARAAQQHPDELRRVFRRARSLILAVCVALTVGVVLGGPLFVTLLYRPRWHAAGPFAQWASIGGWFLLLQLSADRALLALGKTRPLAISNLVSLIVTVAGAFIGRAIDGHFFGHPDGVIGFILGTSAGRVAGHLMIQFAMARSALPIFRQDLLYSALLAAICAAGIGLPHFFPNYAQHHLLYDGIACVTVCTATCAWAALNVWRGIR